MKNKKWKSKDERGGKTTSPLRHYEEARRSNPSLRGRKDEAISLDSAMLFKDCFTPFAMTRGALQVFLQIASQARNDDGVAYKRSFAATICRMLICLPYIGRIDFRLFLFRYNTRQGARSRIGNASSNRPARWLSNPIHNQFDR